MLNYTRNYHIGKWQRALWLARSRPGGLSDSLKWFEAALVSYGQ